MDLILTRSNLRNLIYTLLLLFIYLATLELYQIKTYILFTLAFFLFAHIDITNTNNLERFISVTLTAILCVLILKFPVTIIFSFAVIFLCTYFGYFHQRNAAFTISIITIAALVNPQTNNISAIFAAWAGITILQLITAYGFNPHQYRQACSRSFYHLRELNKEIFACFLNEDYQQQLYLYEHRLHEQKRYVFTWLQRMKELALPEALNISKDVEKIVDLTLDYSQLRHRIMDPSTFQLCAKELTGLMAAIDHIYTQLIKHKKKPEILMIFASKIEQFEANYQQILQVAARDPVDFILFVQTMKMLHKNFNNIILAK